MAPSILARDIMTTKLVTLAPGEKIYSAVGKLLKNQISGAPVIDGAGKFLGIFSERNCMRMILAAAYEQAPVDEIDPFIDRDAPTISEHEDMLAIAETFTRTGARRLPVIRDGLLLGQISRRDVIKKLHESMKLAPTGERNLLYLSSLFTREESPIT